MRRLFVSMKTSFLCVKKLDGVYLELQHLCGIAAGVAALSLHRNTPDLEVAAACQRDIAFAVKLDRLLRRSEHPLRCFRGRTCDPQPTCAVLAVARKKI